MIDKIPKIGVGSSISVLFLAVTIAKLCGTVGLIS